MTECQPLPRNKIIACTTIYLILFFSSCRSLEMIESNWLTVPVDDRGRVEDFSRHLTSHLYENGLLAGVGNDENYLYILFSPDIRHYLRPPSRASLKLWLDAGGTRAKKFGFLFSASHSPESPEASGAPGMKSAPPRANDAGAGTPPERSESLLQFIDEVGHEHSVISADGSQGPQIRFSSDWGDFVYAWRIPLAAGKKENSYALSAQPGQAISVGLLWECEPLPAAQKSDGRFDDGSPIPGLGGGRGGKRMGGGMSSGPGPGGDMAEAPSRRKIWLKIILAQK
jgi:hypothetical protein